MLNGSVLERLQPLLHVESVGPEDRLEPVEAGLQAIEALFECVETLFECVEAQFECVEAQFECVEAPLGLPLLRVELLTDEVDEFCDFVRGHPRSTPGCRVG